MESHNDSCGCPECSLGNNPSDEAIAAIGGCRYCAMTGHEDYPTNRIICRLGHKDFRAGLRPLPPLPEPVDDRPKEGGPWKWMGRGWKNLGYRKDEFYKKEPHEREVIA